MVGIKLSPGKQNSVTSGTRWRQELGRPERLIDSGKGGTPLENLLHRVVVPIVGAKLELRQPFNGAVYKTVSDINGHFVLDTAPTGTYVLHIEEGTALDGFSGLAQIA